MSAILSWAKLESQMHKLIFFQRGQGGLRGKTPPPPRRTKMSSWVRKTRTQSSPAAHRVVSCLDSPKPTTYNTVVVQEHAQIKSKTHDACGTNTHKYCTSFALSWIADHFTPLNLMESSDIHSVQRGTLSAPGPVPQDQSDPHRPVLFWASQHTWTQLLTARLEPHSKQRCAKLATRWSTCHIYQTIFPTTIN